MMKTNALLRRLLIGCLGASVILAGCGGGQNSMPGGAGYSPTTYRWWFNISNLTGKNDPDHPQGEYVWVTRYKQSDTFFGVKWDAVGADCVAPGQTIQRDIKYDGNEWDGLLVKVKLRAEVKAYGAKDCNAKTISDFYGTNCSTWLHDPMHTPDYWYLGIEKIVVRPPHFEMDTHCLLSEGSGTPPPPSVVKRNGS